ncbi:DUF3298 and DUF4163 domain-containing protein [Cytobacillus spongiae]|uniref:DUF3298 and DUF4163 domain-containing protein n=1 Tax=Cytobacillus spongiae TaxID=2901381 RepID=UPI001F36CB9D|nr:DUF3298 and DUF4163 domain-containing protein [Cytobacillus spongiae]UII56786.1 DUF3298 and DUF4163 domain-containing protein [Cytobacillus spongiae]
MTMTFPVAVSTRMVSDGTRENVYYPHIFGMKEIIFEHQINRDIVSQTQKLINEQAGEEPSTVKEMLGSYEIKNNQRQVLSLSLTNYTYHNQAAHGMTLIQSLTFDLKKKQKCTIESLFRPGSDYVKRLSKIIKNQINDRKIQTLGDFTEIRPNQNFYIADKILVIYFQLYEITPYVYGFPMFPISMYDLQDLLVEDGALGRMAVNN